MEVTNTVTVTKHYEKCLNMLLHAVLLYFGGHMIRATSNPITTVVCLSSQNIGHNYFKGEVHSRMAIYFLYANKKVIQKYVIHQNFSFQRALNPYEILL